MGKGGSRTPRALATLAFVALLAGCGKSATREGEVLVRAYNDAAIAAYLTGDLRPLTAVAVPGEVQKVGVLVDFKTSAGLVLESRLEELKVTSAEKRPRDFLVRTRERWRYRDRPARAGPPAGPESVAVMTLEYHFVPDGERWKLVEAKALTSEALDPATPVRSP